jgi:predicted HTH transcriptional regulator
MSIEGAHRDFGIFRTHSPKAMDLKELKALVKQGEGTHLEFKLKASHPEKIVREVVAFANTEGGLLLIGVGDDKSIPGLKFADEDEYMLTRAIEKYCHPAISYRLKRLTVQSEREVLIFSIPPSEHKPHYVIQDAENNLGKVYVRVKDRSVQASKEMREVLKGERKARNIRFTYGEKERTLMQHLAVRGMITVDEFSKAAQIPRAIASRTLVLLVLANVLKILPNEVQDYFVASSEVA